jgi:glucose/arabinose dehydrogenase
MREEDRGAGQPSPYCGELQTMAAVNIREAKLEVVVDGFKYPWAFEFLNENEVIVTEFRGVLIRVNLETGKKTVIKGLPEMEVGKGQRGLNDIALHPRFHENGLIYFSYAMKNDDDPEGNLYASAVARARLVGDRLEDAETIFVAEPYSSSPSNFGGALEFDKTGRLLFGIGDRSLKEQSQIPTVFIGKIVRLTDSGGVPEDNPFVGDTSGVRPEIFVLGVRNPQGLVYDAERDVIFETEHGPMGGDEVNVIVAGKNYGWPTITYGMDYIYSKTGIGAAAEGLEQPLYFYLPSRAISPITVYRGAMFEEWDGDLLVGALRGRSVSRLKVVDGAVKSEMQILDELDDRVRDIKVAQDGAIWILTQADGALYRLSRDRMAVQQQKTAMIPGKRTGEQIYGLICSSCHSRNIDDVPPLKDAQAWRTRLAKGRNVLYQNTFDGMGAMPPRGFCEDCTDEELRSAVDFILAQTNQ